jgi:hypothetical protein
MLSVSSSTSKNALFNVEESENVPSLLAASRVMLRTSGRR